MFAQSAKFFATSHVGSLGSAVVAGVAAGALTFIILLNPPPTPNVAPSSRDSRPATVIQQEELNEFLLERRSANVRSTASENNVDPHDALKEKLMIQRGLITAAPDTTLVSRAGQVGSLP